AYEVAASGYVDLALALDVVLAVRAASRWWSTVDRGHLVESALLLGFALAVKLTALFMVLVVALVLLAPTRQPPPTHTSGHARLPAPAAALCGAIAIGCPWYVRTWVRTGSPVFPFFANLWPGRAPGWDLERSAMLHEFNAFFGSAVKGPLGYLLTPFSLSLGG